MTPVLEDAVRTRLRLAHDPDDSAAIVSAKEKALAALHAQRSPLGRWSAVLDLWCAGWFWEDGAPPGSALFGELSDRLLRGRTRGNVTVNFTGDPRHPCSGANCVPFNQSYLTTAGLLAFANSTGGGREINLINNNLKVPYSDQLSVGIRNRIGTWNTEATVSYIESKDGFAFLLGNRLAGGAFQVLALPPPFLVRLRRRLAAEHLARVNLDGFDVAGLEPLPDEVSYECLRAAIREHSFRLVGKVSPQLLFAGEAQQFVVRHG